MRVITAVVTLLVSLVMLCRSALAANVIHMAMSRSKSGTGPLRRDLKDNLLKRAAVASDLFNDMTDVAGYLANVTVGTPGQTLSLILDTGSSDTFVLAQMANQCNNPVLIQDYGPCIGGTFNPSSSTSFTTITKGGLKIQYLDGSSSAGDYISEDFKISSALVSSLQIGLALHGTIGVGVMGIGYPTRESVNVTNRYPNLVDQLVAQKYINLRAYSLYLDDKETSSGSVIFGAIDTAKFIGVLKALPILKDSETNAFDDFVIQMTSLSITEESGTLALSHSSLSLPVVLDSGTTLIYLPVDLVSSILSKLGAIDDTDNSGLIFVDCDWRITRSDEFISFGFGGSGGPVIRVPLSELILTVQGQYPYSPFQNTCDFGMRAADLSTYLLGDTFLRSAYVVYDLDHNQIALAQTNFEAPGSQVYEIPAGASGIPSLSGQTSGLTQVPESHFTTSVAGNALSGSISSTPSSTSPSSKITLVPISGPSSVSGSGSTAAPATIAISVSISSQPFVSSGTSTMSILSTAGSSASSSTQTSVATQSAASSPAATSTSAGVRAPPALQKGALILVSVSILTALMDGLLLLTL